MFLSQSVQGYGFFKSGVRRDRRQQGQKDNEVSICANLNQILIFITEAQDWSDVTVLLFFRNRTMVKENANMKNLENIFAFLLGVRNGYLGLLSLS
jgi:hypothetical protein